MRFISWNLAKRNRATQEVLDHLDELSVDVALLQESVVHDKAERAGWKVVRAAESPSDCVIMARHGIGITRAEPSAVSQLGRYVAHAELVLAERRVSLLSVHPLAQVVPERHLRHLRPIDVQRESDARVWWSDLFFFLGSAATTGRPAVMAGDWNTSRLFQESLFDRAAAAGWCEVLPHIHGEQQRTWFRGNDRPHGLDHIFCSSELTPLVRDARVDTSVADSAGDHVGRGLSDHAPVILDLDLESLPCAEETDEARQDS
jgi:exonuclease III